MKVTVRLFAGLRERAGGQHVDVELPEGASVGDLLAAMASTPVGRLEPGQCVVAINREYASATALVGPDDEVALIPPVSGGAPPLVRVTGEPLDVAALHAAVRDPRAGAVVVFEGVTREVGGARLRGLRGDGAREAAGDRAPRRPIATASAPPRSSTARAPCRSASRA